LERLNFSRTLRSTKTRKALEIKNFRIKKRTHLPIYRIPKTYKERRRVEPEPLVDILEEKDEVIIVAEFAGFNKESLRTNVKNQRLTLSAETADRKYYKSLNLPMGVIPSSIHVKYKNGVLEIRLKKVANEKAIGKVAGL
jgi:HSP20 family protein